MGRRDTPISALDGKVAEFALDLRAERSKANNPTYEAMARKTGFTAPALSGAARGLRPPTWAVTEAYLGACNVTGEATLRLWRQRLVEVRQWYTAQRVGAKPRRAAVANRTPANGRVVPRLVVPRLVVGEPTAQLTGTTQEMLVQLKQQGGFSFRAIAAASAANDTSPRVLTCSTIHEVLTGRRVVTLAFVESYLDAVAATVAQRNLVLDQLHAENTVKQAAALLEGTLRPRGISSSSAAATLERRPAHMAAEVLEKLPAPLATPLATSLIAKTMDNTTVAILPAGASAKPKPGRHRAEKTVRLAPKLFTALRMRLAFLYSDLAAEVRPAHV